MQVYTRYEVFLRTARKTAEKRVTVSARSETEAVSIAQSQNPDFIAYNVKKL